LRQKGLLQNGPAKNGQRQKGPQQNGPRHKVVYPTSLIIVSLGKALTGFPLPLSGLTDSNRWQLDSKIEKVLLLSPSGGTLTNK